MNTQIWIDHFSHNTKRNDELPLPEIPCQLPSSVRHALIDSLAVFQLGESGSGTRLRRYARKMAPLENFRGYQRAIDLFVAEELSHSRLMARVLKHLGGNVIGKQWTNSVFRHLRFLVNLEFAIQVFLTAELVAEFYFGMLYLRVNDPVVRVMAQKLLRDEMKHLAFQRDFLSERLAELSPLQQRLWRWQFRLIHKVTAAVVAWDHRRCLASLGVTQADFRQRSAQAWARFQDRLERAMASASACAPVPRPSLDHKPHSGWAPARRPPFATHEACPSDAG